MEIEAQTSSVDLSINDLASQITELAGHLNAANHRWLMLIAEFDRRNGWSDWGTHSCAHWLNWKCGIDMGAAREKVRVAHALQSLPKISAAMARGEVSYSKALAMTRVATPATEDYLLMIARHGTAQHVEETVRHFRNALDAEELAKEARQQKQRALTYSYDDDGSLILKARLPAEIGAVVIKALDAAMESVQPNEEDVAAEEIRLSDKERVRRSRGECSAQTQWAFWPRASCRTARLNSVAGISIRSSYTFSHGTSIRSPLQRCRTQTPVIATSKTAQTFPLKRPEGWRATAAWFTSPKTKTARHSISAARLARSHPQSDAR